MKLTLDSVVVRSGEPCFSNIGEEVVLMSVNQGKYFNFDNIGAAIWNQIERPITIRDVCQNLTQSFKVSQDQCEKDVLNFLQLLLEKNLIDA
ncbi:MAG: lasso peptide biosynthesis PqqD family chaperone [Candidatus Ozemobacteraceae bacterium]